MTRLSSKWPVLPLSAVAEIQRDGIDPQSIRRGTRFIGLEHIEPSGEITGRITEEDELASTKFRFTAKHILYGKLRPYLRKIARPNFGGVCSTDILPILPGPKINRDYLFHFLRQPRMVQLATSRCTGANLPRLSPRTLLEFLVPLPPLPEQKRIAAILDKADEIRRKRRQALELADQFLRSVFLDMFGDPVSASRDCQTRRLDEVALINRGRFSPRPRNDPRYYGGEFPFVQTGDIAASDGYLRTWSQTLNRDGKTVSRAFDPGTVLMAIVGATIGETAILTFRSYCPDSVIGIETSPDKAVPEYVEFALRFWKDVLRSRAPETARANINLQTIRPLELPIPSIPLQGRFRTLYRGVYQLKGRCRQVGDSLFESLSQDLFSGSC